MVVRQNEGRFPSPIIFATTPSEENPRLGERPNNWHKRLVDDLKVLRATDESTDNFQLRFWSRDSA